MEKYKISVKKEGAWEYSESFAENNDRGMRIFVSPNYSKVRKGKGFAYLVEIPDYKIGGDDEDEIIEELVNGFYKDIMNRELKAKPDFTVAAETLMACIYRTNTFRFVAINPGAKEETPQIN